MNLMTPILQHMRPARAPEQVCHRGFIICDDCGHAIENDSGICPCRSAAARR